jgi:nucleotide-binding universal stress UspA family protein
MFTNILVATDFSKSSRAALWEAVQLGKRSLSKIHAVHVITYLEDLFRAGRYPIPDTNWRKAIQERLSEFFPKSLYPNSKRQIILGGRIADDLLYYARRHQCGLIVTGSHGRRALTRLLLGSVTTALMRRSEIPVMVVREEDKSNVHYQNFNRILVPIDFSEISIKALNFAAQLAEFVESEIHLVHVVDINAITAFQHTYRLPTISMPKNCELNVDLTLYEMINKYSGIPQPKVRTLMGDPAEEILKYASEHNCGLIIMGTHGRNGFQRTIIGSVTTTVLANTRNPVITISSAENLLDDRFIKPVGTEIQAKELQQQQR